MKGVRVSLSSGDVFYVKDAGLDEVADVIARSQAARGMLIRVGGRWVNGNQVAQLSVEEIPSIELPEELPGLKEAA